MLGCSLIVAVSVPFRKTWPSVGLSSMAKILSVDLSRTLHDGHIVALIHCEVDIPSVLLPGALKTGLVNLLRVVHPNKHNFSFKNPKYIS